MYSGTCSPDLRRLLAVCRAGPGLGLAPEDSDEQSVFASASDRFAPGRNGVLPVDMPAASTGPDLKATIAPMRTYAVILRSLEGGSRKNSGHTLGMPSNFIACANKSSAMWASRGETFWASSRPRRPGWSEAAMISLESSPCFQRKREIIHFA